MEEYRRFIYKGTKEQFPKVEAAMKKLKVTRKSAYLILKYFEINPDSSSMLKEEFPDV